MSCYATDYLQYLLYISLSVKCSGWLLWLSISMHSQLLRQLHLTCTTNNNRRQQVIFVQVIDCMAAFGFVLTVNGKCKWLHRIVFIQFTEEFLCTFLHLTQKIKANWNQLYKTELANWKKCLEIIKIEFCIILTLISAIEYIKFILAIRSNYQISQNGLIKSSKILVSVPISLKVVEIWMGMPISLW